MAKLSLKRESVKNERGEVVAWRYVIEVTEWGDGGETCMFEDDLVRFCEGHGDMGCEIDEQLMKEVIDFRENDC